MLSSTHRMRSSADFSDTVRGGRRAGSRRLVIHLRTPELSQSDQPTTVGFVVSKAVGGSVVRNKVKRRLRHQVRDVLNAFPGGSRVVVRALPEAAAASSAQLGEDLQRAVRRLLTAGAR